MRFIFEQVRTGGDRNFGYLIGDRDAGKGVLIDPSYDPKKLVTRARDQGLEITHVINTHGHADHTNGNKKAMKLTGAPLAAHRSAASRPEVALDHEDRLTVGDLELRFLHTPGHAVDHLCIVVDDVCVTGDLLFVGKIGGTRTEEDARTEYESLKLILALPEGTTIWPGHDYGCRSSSTIALEKRTNPFLLCEDLPAFLDLKANWSGFKKRHGLA